MKKENKTLIIAALISLIAAFSLSVKAQSTINTYTYTTKFLQSDFQQIYQGARIAAPTMTLPNSMTTYTYSKPFNNSDNQQVYEAIRGIGATVSSLTANYWSINGNSLTAGTEFLGSTNAMPLYIKTNNTMAATIGTNQAVNFVSSVTTPSLYGSTTNSILNIFSNANGGGTVNIGTGTGTTVTNNPFIVKTNSASVLIQAYPSSTNPAIYLNQLSAPTTTNYTLLDYDGITYLNNGGSGKILNLLTNHSNRLAIKGTFTSGTNYNFEFLPPTNTGQTASVLQFGYLLRGASRQWNTGDLGTQKEFELQSPTWSAVGSSIFNVGYNAYFRKPTAGTNVTVLNNYSAGFEGNVNIEGLLRVGNTATTSLSNATLNVTGTMSVSSTATVASILNTPTVNSTGSNLILNSSTNTNLNVNSVTILNAYSSGVAVTGLVSATGNISSSSKTAGVGYAVGSGSTVTQGTSRTTGVTINSITGSITLFSTAGSAIYQSFTVTNSAVTAKDLVILNQQTGTDKYILLVTNVAAGSFQITFATTGGVTSEAPVINFAVIKGQTN